MPEHFCVSFLAAKSDVILNRMKRIFTDELGIPRGKSFMEKGEFLVLRNKKVALFFYDNEKTDYVEVLIGFPYQLFHKKSFDKEIKALSQFVDFCFGLSDEILYALCSYESNAYFLGDADFLKDIDDELLLKFPIAFVKKEIKVNLLPAKELEHSHLFINHKAQDLFSVM